MRISDDAVRQLSTYFGTQMECLEPDSGYEVVRTPFLYPDRDHVELFVRRTDDGRLMISDLGQSVIKLAQYGFVLRNSPRRRAMLFQITSSLGVRYENGSLLVVEPLEELGPAMWRLIMALQRLSDLVFTVGSYVRATFGDQFENYVAERGLSYTRGVQVDLPDYRFTGDFSVNGGKIVQLLSANSAEYAAVRSHKVYVDFSEMKLANDARQRLAVLDDSQPFWSDQLLFALRHMADRVLYWTEKNSLEDALTNDGLV